MIRPLAGAQLHWLAYCNASVALVLGLALLAPALARSGFGEGADALYRLFLWSCHEWPFRSLFLFGPQATYSIGDLREAGVTAVYSFRGSEELGYKVAFCVRNLAIFSAILAAGMLYAIRRKIADLPLVAFLLLCLPMAVDGVTQLVGWRESTWELRVATGALFGIACVWLLYPRLDRSLRSPAVRPQSR